MEQIRPYSEYKDSGQPWLGKMPAHWKVVPGFAAFHEKQVKNTGMKVSDVLSLSYGKIVVKPPEKLHGLVPESFETYQIVEPGDIIIRPTDLQNDWNTIRVGLSNIRGIITAAYMCLNPTTLVTPEYCYLSLLSYDIRKYFYGMGSGLRQNLDYRDLRRFPLFVPPPNEQSAVVRFVAALDQRVSLFVRAKRRLIQLLTEQKQAVINDAVQRISNPACRQLPMRAVMKLVKRFGFRDKTVLSLFRDYGVIPKDSRENLNADVRDLALCQLVEPGDVVVNKMKAWQGSIAVSDIEGIVSPDYMVLKTTTDNLCPLFLHYALRSPKMIGEYRKRAYGVRPGQWRLMYPEFSRIEISLPSAEEQESISRGIQRDIASVERAIADARREIELIREYRATLLSSVVLGAVDVYPVAAALPEANLVEQSGFGESEDDEREGEEAEVAALGE